MHLAFLFVSGLCSVGCAAAHEPNDALSSSSSFSSSSLSSSALLLDQISSRLDSDALELRRLIQTSDAASEVLHLVDSSDDALMQDVKHEMGFSDEDLEDFVRLLAHLNTDDALVQDEDRPMDVEDPDELVRLLALLNTDDALVQEDPDQLVRLLEGLLNSDDALVQDEDRPMGFEFDFVRLLQLLDSDDALVQDEDREDFVRLLQLLDFDSDDVFHSNDDAPHSEDGRLDDETAGFLRQMASLIVLSSDDPTDDDMKALESILSNVLGPSADQSSLLPELFFENANGEPTEDKTSVVELEPASSSLRTRRIASSDDDDDGHDDDDDDDVLLELTYANTAMIAVGLFALACLYCMRKRSRSPSQFNLPFTNTNLGNDGTPSVQVTWGNQRQQVQASQSLDRIGLKMTPSIFNKHI